MIRRLLSGATSVGLVLTCLMACSSESGGGPPSAPCNDKTKGSAPICGKTCANMCGCNACNPGTQTFIDSTLYVCSGGCFALSSGSGGGSSGGSGGGSGGGSSGGAGVGGDPGDGG